LPIRLLDSYLWRPGLLQLLPSGTSPHGDLVEQLQKLLQLDCKSIHRRVVDTFIRFTGPVYFIHGNLCIGRILTLNLFEDGDLELISRVMEGWPESARRGDPICANDKNEWPLFVCGHPFYFSSELNGCLVRVRQCAIRPGISAHVTIEVVAYVSLERIWETDDGKPFAEATCTRLGLNEPRKRDKRLRRIDAQIWDNNWDSEKRGEGFRRTDDLRHDNVWGSDWSFPNDSSDDEFRYVP
jgi:hypothetical protein